MEYRADPPEIVFSDGSNRVRPMAEPVVCARKTYNQDSPQREQLPETCFVHPSLEDSLRGSPPGGGVRNVLVLCWFSIRLWRFGTYE